MQSWPTGSIAVPGSGYFSEAWKIVIIMAAPKPNKDNRNRVNYRSISLLFLLFKWLERIILKKLNNAIGLKIRHKQFAFRSEHSTTLQLVKQMDQLVNNYNNIEKTSIVFLDVEKVIDRVWHDDLNA